MDMIYRGVETLLLVCAFALGTATLATSFTHPLRATPDSVTLPMLTVVADGAAPVTR